MDDIKLLGIFKERNFGLTGIISVLILTLIIGLLAFKTRNDQWNVWKLNKDITIVPDCGMGPGMNVTLGLLAMEQLDKANHLRIWDSKILHLFRKNQYLN